MFKIPIFHMILKITNSRLLNRISKWAKSLWGRDSRQVVMVEEIPILEGGFYEVSNGSRCNSLKHRAILWWTVFRLSQTLYLKTVEGASNIVWISSHTWWRHQMETFSAYCPFVRGIHKGQWRGALMFSVICVWINNWVNNREAGDLRRHRGHYDVNGM